MSGDINLRINISAADKASGVFKNIGASGLSVGGILKGVGGLATVGLGLAAGAAIKFGVDSVKAFGDYQQSQKMVQALTGSSNSQMAQYDKGLKTLAVTAGSAPVALSKGLYNVLSASYSGATAMKVLTLATQDSKIGMTDATVTTDALTNVLRSFGTKNQDITRVNGEMLQTVTLGKATFEQYATTIVKSASASTQFHVSMETMNAAWSTMTSSGIKAAQASTDYQSSLKVMYGNIGTVTKSLHGNGIAFDETKFNAMSYGDKVQYLNGALEIANAKHVKVTGVTLQAAQAISTISNHIGDYNGNLAKLSDKQAMTTKTAQAWAITQSGVNEGMDRATARYQVFQINVGEKLVGAFSKLQGAAMPIIGMVADWAVKNDIVGKSIDGVTFALTWILTSGPKIQSVIATINGKVQDAKRWFDQWKPVIQNTGIALTVFFLPALIKSGVEAGIAGVKIAAQFIASMVQTGIAAVVNGVKVTVSFIGSMIMAGVQGYASAGKLAVFIGSMIASGFQATVNGAKIAAGFVGSMIAAGFQSTMVSARVMVGFVASMIQAGIKATISGAQIVGTFVASLITTGSTALATGATMMAGLVPSIISVATEAVATAAVAIPSMIAGFGAWAVSAGIAAAATLAATWPVLAIIAAVALLGVGIYLLVTHWKQVVQFLQSAWQGFTSWLHTSIGQVGGWMQGLGTSISGWFSGLVGKAVSWGANLIQGFINGIGSMLGNVAKAAGNVAQTVKNFLGFHSPAKMGPGSELNLWGPNLVKTFASDMIKTTPKARNAAELMMRQVRDAIAKDSYNLDIAKVSGNKGVAKHISKELALLKAQMDAYKRIVSQDGYTYTGKGNNPIDFSHATKKHKKPVGGYGPVYASQGGSGSSTSVGASSGYSGSNAPVYIINNYQFSFTPSRGRTEQEVDEMYKQFKKKIAKDVRVQGNYETTTSGVA